MPKTNLPAPPDDWPFAAEIRAFMEADAREFPEPGGVVFIGSSSITRWMGVQRDFPFANIIRRGFGGSMLHQSTLYADRIAIPYQPRLIVVYAGDNDLALGETPAEVLADFRAFVEKVHAELPDTLIAFVSIKLSVSRWNLKDEIMRANDLIEEFCRATPNVHFIDVTPALLDENGEPRPELFADGLHPNRAGYNKWIEIIAPAIRKLLGL